MLDTIPKPKPEDEDLVGDLEALYKIYVITGSRVILALIRTTAQAIRDCENMRVMAYARIEKRKRSKRAKAR
jgi:hypothetical protein